MKTSLLAIVALLLAACGGNVEPTTVPVPTFTPTADLLDAYRPAIIEHTANLAEAIGGIGDLLAAPQPGEETWIVKMAGWVAQVKIAAREIAELRPPAQLADYHAAMVTASATCEQFADTLTAAIDNANTVQLAEAAVTLQSCADQIAAATKLIPD